MLLTHSYTKYFGEFCGTYNVKMSPWIFPFIYNNWYVKILFLAPLLLIFCDAPFVDDNQPYVMIRSGRKCWSVGQIAYVVITSAVYFIFLFVISLLINLPHIELSWEWGKAFGTLANTDAARAMGVLNTVTSRTLYYFSPIQAVGFTFLLSWLCGIFLGMIVYLVNALTNKRNLGVLAAAFFLIISISKLPDLNWYSPVCWISLDNIDIGGLSSNPSITYVLGTYAVLIGVLLVSAFAVNQKQAIYVLPPV